MILIIILKFVIRYSLFVIRYSLFVIRYSLFVIHFVWLIIKKALFFRTTPLLSY